ncbi:hypothetical protein [Mucilaginibacter sp.]|uniref:hypothetical protein n=1 Tax=Mucilaginibacter sp. TaxID=1882438 RepID=UPI002604FCEE|nr:hypothetical protein [Mucilaginibacter sp.]MDB5029682.1 hypothetical protein [Mucilaginibacter sp.]
MKKLFITAAIATMFSITAFAANGKHNKTEDKVTYAALDQFAADFKSADNVVWTVTPNCQKVTFINNNNNYTAFYTFDGDYLGLTQDIAYKRIPTSVRSEIANDYKGFEVADVIKYKTTEADEPVAYFVDIKKTGSEILLKVSADKSVSFFKEIE